MLTGPLGSRVVGMGAALLLCAGLGCTPSTKKECTADDQCSSGQACRSNRCETVENTTDAGNLVRMDASVAGADASQSDAATQQNGDSGMVVGPCPHNDDGVLTSDELPLALNVEARFIAATSDGGITVDLVGHAEDGGTVWDFTGMQPGDAPQQVVAKPLTGAWFESSFPDGGYYVPLDGTGESLGIYQRTATQVVLLGVASRTPDLTLLKENPPVTVLKFPLQMGTSFSTTTVNSGTLNSYPLYYSSDTYAFTVDGRGIVRTPAADYPSLRVRVEQTVQIGLLQYKWIRYSFVTACFSQVANVSSLEGETNLLFTRAGELRRLGLPQ